MLSCLKKNVRKRTITPKEIEKRLDALAKKLEGELEGADLFAPLPPTEDCPICFIPLSRIESNIMYQSCCKKRMCCACYWGSYKVIKKENAKNAEKEEQEMILHLCPFCREPETTTNEEEVKKLEAQAARNDPNAFMMLTTYHDILGVSEHTKDELGKVDVWIRAAEIGSANACGCIGNINDGDSLEDADDRESFFYRMGALRGDVVCRHIIGQVEYDKGNYELSIRHWKIAAEAGSQPSLDELKAIYHSKKPGKEFISKEGMGRVYRLCHSAQEAVWSEEREKYRKDDDDWKC